MGVAVLLGFIWLTMFSSILKTDNSVWHATWLDIVHRTSLMQTLPKDRGFLWKAWSYIFHWTYEQPLYLFGPTGTDKLKRASGFLPVPLAEGVAFFDHRTISEMLMSNNQPRGRFLATGAVPDVCLGKDTLIFLPTTPGGKSLHDQLRSFVVKVLRGFYVNETTDRGVQWMGEPVVEKDNVPQPTSKQLVRYLVSTMFYRLFGRAPTSSEADTILSYFDYVAVCFFGTGIPGDLMAKLSKVPEIRKAVLDIARRSPTGDLIAVEVAKWNEHCDNQPNRLDETDCLPIDETAMLQQVVDGYLFAGLLGTTSLATSAFNRLRSHPALYGPMWQRDPISFLVECARLDPPVSSVTALLDNDRELYVGVGYADMFGGHEAGGHKVLFPKGTPIQMLITQANRDSSVFGHTANQFDPTRSTLGHVLSWNGLEMNVRERSAPRGCPGHDLAIDVTRVLITQLWNDKNMTPSGDPAPGDCFDGMECHNELDLSTVLVYERIAKPRRSFELLFTVVAIGLLSLELVRCVLWSGPCSLNPFAFLWRLIFAGNDVLAFIWKGALLAQILCLFGYLRDATLPAHLSMVGVANALLLIAVVVVAGRSGWLYGYATSVFVLFVTFVTAAIVTMTSFGLGEYFVNDAAFLVTVYFLGAVALCFLSLYFLYPRDKRISEHFWLALIFAFAAIPLFKYFATGLLLAVLCGTGFVYCFDVVLQDIRVDYLDRRVILLTNRVLQPIVSVLVVLVLLAPVFLGVYQVNSAYKGICTEWMMPNGTVVDPSADPLCKSPLLDRLDTFTKFVWGSTRSDANDESRTPVKDSSEIHPPVRRAQLTSLEILNFPYYIPYQDEDTPMRSWQEGLLSWFADYITHSEVFFPLKDVVYDFNSDEEARRLTRLINGPLAFNITDEENTSDKALVRWTFFGLGAHRVRRVKSSIQAGWNVRRAAREHKEAFVVDLLWMASLDVRPGFEHYGAAAYFGSKEDGFPPRRISLPKSNNPKVWRDVYPGDADWDYAKYAYRSSLLVGVTLADHLSLAHLRLSSVVVQAARETLDAIHPLRLLLAPFSFRTIEINRGAASNLAAKLGVLHRAVALSWRGLETGFRVTLTSDYEYLLEEQLREGLNDTIPYVQDGQDFKVIVETFVTNYLKVYYPTEDALFNDADLAHFLREIDAFGFPVPPIRNRQELIHFVREFIMMVTAYHYQVGTVAPYVLDPYAASGKIRPGVAHGDVQTTFLVSVIALFTSYPQPMLLGNFSHLLLQDEHYTRTNAIFDQFHADLDSLVLLIDARNQQRLWPFEAFNPRFLRSAVSI